MGAAAAVGSLALSGYSAYQQSQAAGEASAAGAANAVQSAMNAGRSAAAEKYAGEEARRVGAINAQNTLAQAQAFKGSQTALNVATGFVSDSGTSQVLQQQTENLARTDALATLLDAGQRNVAGDLSYESIIKTGASSAAAQNQSAQAQAQAMRNQAMGTLLGGFTAFSNTKYGSGVLDKVGTQVQTSFANMKG